MIDRRRPEKDERTMKTRITRIARTIDGLANDARYHDLRRTYGEYSREVLRHLESCAAIQERGANHT